MYCHHCNSSITPGTEIAVGPYEKALLHCPYCLRSLSDSSTDAALQAEPEAIAAKREEARKLARLELLESLRKSSADGQVHCPICERTLNQNDQSLLASHDNFRCHLCGHDLATYAYRQKAHDDQRWLPVIYGLADVKAEPKCTGCSLAGALARACQNTLSCTPKYYPVQSNLLVNLLARTDWKQPDEECEKTCFAAAQYRANVGDLMKLL